METALGLLYEIVSYAALWVACLEQSLQLNLQY